MEALGSAHVVGRGDTARVRRGAVENDTSLYVASMNYAEANVTVLRVRRWPTATAGAPCRRGVPRRYSEVPESRYGQGVVAVDRAHRASPRAAPRSRRPPPAGWSPARSAWSTPATVQGGGFFRSFVHVDFSHDSAVRNLQASSVDAVHAGPVTDASCPGHRPAPRWRAPPSDRQAVLGTRGQSASARGSRAVERSDVAGGQPASCWPNLAPFSSPSLIGENVAARGGQAGLRAAEVPQGARVGEGAVLAGAVAVRSAWPSLSR